MLLKTVCLYYIHTVFNEPQSRVLGVKISADVTLTGLGAVPIAAATANFT